MIAKRAFDLFCVIPGLFILSPAFLVIALSIKLDSQGSIFFRQTRVGRYGKTFEILKFRTMVQNAETMGLKITVGRDPRVTRYGSVLRKYKLDELPQLINVLHGEMSLVGPRPEVPEYVAYYGERAKHVVFSVRPGITDPASIFFYDEEALLAKSENPERLYIDEIIPRKIAFYTRYVETANIWTDLLVILRTAMAIVRKRTAEKNSTQAS